MTLADPMSAAQPPPRWIPVALSADIAPATPVPVLLDGRELVVWRGTGGAVRVWEDRCPHRGMRLSFGFVRGDTLACLYHGWRFGLDAGCTAIPAHPDLEPPKTLSARSFAVAEAGGLVFTTGSPDRPAAPPPVPDGMTPVRSLLVAAPVETVRARLASAGLEPSGDLGRMARADGPALLLAVHGLDGDRTMLHALAEGDVAGADLHTAMDALERLRHSLEEADA
ncbi:Rieske (2Fe-2S) protein [Mongoliimonas terrestris]|uniref:Rieske (2Fe-2S) protein n=1 Tax=Mongoliimonas terrestris TaxID=1709001 RepID=UPI0009FB1E77|nr:Rieske (2Fe-2S) protein [Mongoliimonas terrestris]